MRRSTTLLTTGSLSLIALGALAAEVIHTDNAQWGAFPATNINTGTNLDLEIVETQDASLLLYRQPWNGVDFRVELAKDDDTLFAGGDRCLEPQTFSDTDTVLVNGTRYRGGQHEFFDPPDRYLASIPDGGAIALPASLGTVTAVRFVTHGGKLADVSYQVRFAYGDGTPEAVVTIPVLQDDQTGAARNGSGTNYTKTAYTGALTPTIDAGVDADGDNVSDCAGSGADEIVVTNPNPAATVTAITFAYQDYDEVAALPWLGGPLAVTLDTTEADLDATFLYKGDILSPAGGAAVTDGTDALWYEVAWSPVIANGQVLLAFTCGDDPAFPDWPIGAETVDLSLETSPYSLASVCDGPYLRYQLEFLAEFDVSPVLNSITFTYDPDLDGDGFGADGVATATDCADDDPTRYPGAFEIVGDGIDQDCDGKDVCFLDTDNDGDRDGIATIVSDDADCADANEAPATAPIDCAPFDPARSSAAAELPADGVDQNCDLIEDCFRDLDGDGFGTPTAVPGNDLDCADTGEAANSDDCNDGDITSFPGAAVDASHVADGLDHDCDSFEECFADVDRDTYGSAAVIPDDGDGNCLSTSRESDVSGDCDDGDASVYPTAPEIAADGIDQDCDLADDCFRDLDGDGFGTSFVIPGDDLDCLDPGESGFDTDCDDDLDTAFPGAPVNGTHVADGRDHDCDGREECFVNVDGDPFGGTAVIADDGDGACLAGDGESTVSGDCDDADPTRHPAAAEIPGDGADQNCDSIEACFQDLDLDTFGSTVVIASSDLDCADLGESSLSTDCNDANNASFPGASILGVHVADGVDRDCDGREECYVNVDKDAFGGAAIIDDDGDGNCQAGDGESAITGDCNDAVATIFPGATEVTADNVDQDCDGHDDCYVDADRDAYGTSAIVESVGATCAGVGEAFVSTDCDDGDVNTNPGVLETIGNNKDNNCNGEEICWNDADDDGARSGVDTRVSSLDQDCTDPFEGQTTDALDCDETDPTQFPGNTETTGNGVDNDCDGIEVCFADTDNDDYRHVSNTVNSTADEDCGDNGEALATQGIDCNDLVPTTNPGAPDVCGDGVDNDCDNVGDNPGSPTFGVAGGWSDDDGDGLSWSEEQILGTNDCDADSDDDGLDDFTEDLLGTNPLRADSDDDGVSDLIEVDDPSNPLDTDGDGTLDALDPDDDGDGWDTIDEDVNRNGAPLDDDTDRDGIPNFRDTDDDDDTVPTRSERVADTDGDGTPDHLDDDDDGDGLRTALEDVEVVNGDPLDDDTDNDGTPDFLDDDDDDDGVPTRTEDVDGDGTYVDDDTDGDGTPNYRDTDDDGDGIPTLVEGTGNPDGDALPNHLDTDSDNDTFLDSEEGLTNSDTDATADYLDTDSDNDGVADRDEVKGDSDVDGKPDRVDDDDDNDGILTSIELGDPVLDADGVPNYLDLDSDGDGWSDQYEWSRQSQADKDQDDDGAPDYTDLDSDGDLVPDAAELGTEAADVDSDADGLTNRLDNDDDGDTVLTRNEDVELVNGNPRDDDTDDDGTPDYLDTDDDADTILTKNESPDGDGDPRNDDTDGDGLPNYRDADDDGDGVLTAAESPDGDGDPLDDDNDRDGIPNYRDLDDDGDGIPTRTEGTLDPDGDGTPNHLDLDDDGDGWTDAHEFTTGAFAPDNDADGTPDYLDLDSDDDEVPDADENGGKNKPAAATNTDGDAQIDRIDADDDGDLIPTRDEEPLTNDGDPQNDDSDGDGIPNYLDADDDNDNVPTREEDLDGDGDPRDDNTDGDALANYLDADDDGDGEPTASEDLDGDGNPLDDNTDGDALANWLDVDDDNDGIATIIETREFSRDVDADGTPNHLDSDSDGDGWTDTGEWTGVPGVIDFDGDGVPDYVDADSDGDSVLDRNEGSSNAPLDTDGDGFHDRVDTDDDNDRIPTSEEEPESADGNPRNDDWDGDGIADFRDADDDGDGVDTVDEDEDASGDPRDDDHDFDGLPNYLDDDDDDDGVPTRDEDPDRDGDPRNDDTDGDGDPNYLDNDDDNDGQLTRAEDDGSGPQSWDFDGDGLPNYLDADDDDDGVQSGCEIFFGVNHLLVDTDGDTFNDGLEWYNWLDPALPPSDYRDRNGGVTGTDCYTPWDRDSDGFIDALDFDDDGDGILTIEEGAGDDDCPGPGIGVPVGDGIPNYLDYDSDGDLLPDDISGDGASTGDGLGDVDADAIVDFLDCDNSGCAGDSDLDGIPNCDEYDNCPFQNPANCALDPDIDDDGILDGAELGADPDCYDAVSGKDGGAPCNGQDTDGDGIIDLLDTDDDGDRVDTIVETGIVCPSGEAWTLEFDLGASAWVYVCPDGTTLPGELQNTDEDVGAAYPLDPDDVPDYLDLDDDGDGKPTLEEGDGDLDADGVVNYLDPNDFDGPLADADLDGMTNEVETGLGLDPYRSDSDGDGIADDAEIGDPSSPRDTDGDGIIDALDTDDDGDGLPTAFEGQLDTDGDGTPDYLDTDSDGDGRSDSDERAEDADCDGVDNYVDANDEDGPCVTPGTTDSGPNRITYAGCQCSTSSGATGGMLWVAGLFALVLRRRR